VVSAVLYNGLLKYRHASGKARWGLGAEIITESITLTDQGVGPILNGF